MLGLGGKAPLAEMGRFGVGPPMTPPGACGRPIAPSVPFNPSTGFGGSCAPDVKLGAMSRLELVECKDQD